MSTIPTNPMEAILQSVKLETNLFPPTSRYHGKKTVTLEIPDGKTVVYLERRFIAQPERFDLIREHTVTEGDRPDNVAAEVLGDPEQFWRLADANNVLRPQELTQEVGRKLRVTQPEGVPGVSNV